MRDPNQRRLDAWGEGIIRDGLFAALNPAIHEDKNTDKKTGEQKENTEWVRASFFGKLAEVAAKYLKKGGQVYIEGSLRTRKYTDKDGVEKYATDIKATDMKMLGGRQDDATQSSPAQSKSKYEKPQSDFSDMGDDIPFN